MSGCVCVAFIVVLCVCMHLAYSPHTALIGTEIPVIQTINGGQLSGEFSAVNVKLPAGACRRGSSSQKATQTGALALVLVCVFVFRRVCVCDPLCCCVVWLMVLRLSRFCLCLCVWVYRRVCVCV